MKSKKHVIYVEKSSVGMRMMNIILIEKKVKDHCHYTGKSRGAAHSICNLKYKVPKDISIVIHNASYDTHFITNRLAKELKGKLDCIGEHMEKYITFSVPIKKNAMMVKQFHIN